MALGPALQLRQSQQLVMTPQMQQAIKLLQLSNLELEAHLAAEMEANPLIEIARGEPEEAAAPGEEPPPAAEASGPPEEMRADELIAAGGALADAPLDADYVGETFHHAPETGGGGGEAGEIDIEAFATSALSLADHLEAQAAAQLTGVNLAVARHLIDQIDAAGYLRADLGEVAMLLGVSRGRVEAILRLIQGFDPTGVGARSLGECLLLQARERGPLDRPLRMLIKNLELLGRGDLAALRRICGVGPDELAALVRLIRSLDPKPGLRFDPAPAQANEPDVLVRRTAAGGWLVELNSATLPRVLVNRRYHAELAAGAKGPARGFLSEALASANWLSKALDQRARTIINVATEIVRQQEGFFRNGVRHLRPLNLRHVADVVGLHPSTVSRVTSNKYLHCERGLFELKYFFTPALAVVGGSEAEAVSTTSVKRRIQELIAAETHTSVRSDDQLVDLLRAEGFDVARRTVAKYREGLGLGSSVERRRRFALAG